MEWICIFWLPLAEASPGCFQLPMVPQPTEIPDNDSLLGGEDYVFAGQ